MSALIRLPVLKPNGPGGTFLVDSGTGTYPAGTQTHAYCDPSAVVGLVPIEPGSLILKDFAGGCHVLLIDGHSINTTMPADEVNEALRGMVP